MIENTSSQHSARFTLSRPGSVTLNMTLFEGEDWGGK